MKEKRNFLMGMLLGVLICWALLFFTLPFILKKFSFLLGFVVCLLLISFGIIGLLIRDGQPLSIVFFNGKRKREDVGALNRTDVLIRILVFSFIVMGGLVSSFFMFKQNELVKSQMLYQQKTLEHQSALLESVRNSSLASLMSNILDKVDDELKDNSKGVLTEETIARIAALSYSFKPYQDLEDSLSKKKFSPERGQLLLALSKINMDSASFDQIKRKTTFSGADLRGADFRKANLQHVDLQGANLKDADLRGANLKDADLRHANLWGVNLSHADLSHADLRRADLKWAEFSGAILKEVNLEGADLTCAKLAKVNFNGAHLSWSILNEAFLNEANLSGVVIEGAAMRRANLTGANLTGAALRWIDFKEANLYRTNFSYVKFNSADFSGVDLTEVDLTGADLYKITVKEENWFEKLAEWRVKGIDKIQGKYNVIEDQYGVANFRLIPIK